MGIITSVCKIKLLKTPPQEFDFLTREEANAFLESISDKLCYEKSVNLLDNNLKINLNFKQHLGRTETVGQRHLTESTILYG